MYLPFYVRLCELLEIKICSLYNPLDNTQTQLWERECALYYLLDNAFSKGHIQSLILLAPRWRRNSLIYSAWVQNWLQISIKGSTLPQTVFWQMYPCFRPSQSMTLVNLDLGKHQALVFAVKSACRSFRLLEHFNRIWEGWVFCFFSPYVLPSHIDFNTYSMLFIKDITPFRSWPLVRHFTLECFHGCSSLQYESHVRTTIAL